MTADKQKAAAVAQSKERTRQKNAAIKKNEQKLTAKQKKAVSDMANQADGIAKANDAANKAARATMMTRGRNGGIPKFGR